MSHTQHTPGPWHAEDYTQDDGPVFFVIPPTNFGSVAKVYNEDDARLIAAAPEMLDALRLTEEFLMVAPETVGKLLTKVQSAIAKAEQSAKQNGTMK